MYDANNVIFLPDDHLYISWDVNETGSQIEDYYVGFGLANGNITLTSIMDYKSTNGRSYFKMRHIGVGTGILFYVYIKTVNKAKIEQITEIGPILIDETPPIFSKKPTIRIGTDTVTIGWDRNTVYDLEQSSPINQMFFQIGIYYLNIFFKILLIQRFSIWLDLI
jgi:hypothetical protein